MLALLLAGTALLPLGSLQLHERSRLDTIAAVRDLATWTILQQMALITSDCGKMRSLSIKWP